MSYPLFEFKDQANSEKEVPFQEQVLILHYLMAAKVTDFGIARAISAILPI